MSGYRGWITERIENQEMERGRNGRRGGGGGFKGQSVV